MNKCTFCEKSNPNGKCFYSSQTARESYCKIAIQRMMKVLEKGNKK
jgi:hypothetical protein